MRAAQRGASRLARTVRSLAAITALGAGLAGYNAYSLRRDTAIATGPHSEAQHDFFLGAADRPDIDLLFKRMTPQQRLAMARRIGEYDDPKLALLIGTLLGTFDSDARRVLTEALAAIGRKHPEPVAEQLKQSGSLQLLAIDTALRGVGNRSLGAVAAQLKVHDARPNAVAFLVDSGAPAVPVVLPYLDDPDKDVREAAADALGKIGDRSAVTELVAKYNRTAGDERFAYLSAIAGIGASETEELLSAAATDANLPTPRRAQAMLGLGRIGSDTAIAKLWAFAGDDDVQIRDAMISALQLSGDAALKGDRAAAVSLHVAAGIKTPNATAYIARFLAQPAFLRPAAEVAGNRPDLVEPLVDALRKTTDGEAIDAVMKALTSTPQGIAQLKRLTSDPDLGGFAMRRLRLAGS